MASIGGSGGARDAGGFSGVIPPRVLPTAFQTLKICPPIFSEGKLDGTNYTLWKFKISAILDSYELLETVLGIDLEPQSTPHGDGSSQYRSFLCLETLECKCSLHPGDTCK